MFKFDRGTRDITFNAFFFFLLIIPSEQVRKICSSSLIHFSCPGLSGQTLKCRRVSRVKVVTNNLFLEEAIIVFNVRWEGRLQ